MATKQTICDIYKKVSPNAYYVEKNFFVGTFKNTSTVIDTNFLTEIQRWPEVGTVAAYELYSISGISATGLPIPQLWLWEHFVGNTNASNITWTEIMSQFAWNNWHDISISGVY